MECSFLIHNKTVSCVITAPLSFHVTHPVGQVLNRLSQDINNLDELLPYFIYMSLIYSAPTIATIILAGITNPLLITLILISLPIYYIISKICFTSGDVISSDSCL